MKASELIGLKDDYDGDGAKAPSIDTVIKASWVESMISHALGIKGCLSPCPDGTVDVYWNGDDNVKMEMLINVKTDATVSCYARRKPDDKEEKRDGN